MLLLLQLLLLLHADDDATTTTAFSAVSKLREGCFPLTARRRSAIIRGWLLPRMAARLGIGSGLCREVCPEGRGLKTESAGVASHHSDQKWQKFPPLSQAEFTHNQVPKTVNLASWRKDVCLCKCRLACLIEMSRAGVDLNLQTPCCLCRLIARCRSRLRGGCSTV